VNLLLLTVLFLKVGAFVFGGGFAMIPIIEAEVVLHRHWLTHREFLDALALGQVTPGPFLISSAFIGYKVGGVIGALLATIAIFAPSFLMTLVVSGPLIRLQGSEYARVFLKGVLPGIVAVLVIAGFRLGQAQIKDGLDVGIFLVALLLLVRFKIDPALVVLGGAVAGLLLGMPGAR
jgi:chromate transporter